MKDADLHDLGGSDPAADAIGTLTEPPATRRGPSGSALSFRIAIAGGLLVVVLAVLGFRLWSVELLSGSHYLNQANANRSRQVQLPAPRGRVTDRNGQLLVDDSNSLVVELATDKLPQDPAARDSEETRLAEALRIPVQQVRQRVAIDSQARPFQPATIKTDVDFSTVSYLLEHQGIFPGVTASRDLARTYPAGQLASQLLGTIGKPEAKQLQENKFPGAAPGDFVGQAGIEYTYDRFLRGQDGSRRVQVNAGGEPIGGGSVREPVPGDNVKLAIDSRLQQVAQQAMGGRPGGFVVMDTTNGEVHALGSTPTYNPNVFANATDADYAKLTSPQNGSPLTDRATQGEYPTGSTFKLVTALAGLQSGVTNPSQTVNDTGSIVIGGHRFQGFEGQGHGPVAMREALKVSDDVYFYDLGARLGTAQGGQLLQNWAGQLGFGQSTGIDVPEEENGLVPNPQWRDRLFQKHQTDRPWGIGDNVNLAIGQGDLEANPLQLAVAYAALANGGNILTPHVGLSIDNGDGQTVQPIEPPPRRRVDISPQNRRVILDGMRAAASQPGGTTAQVFGGFPIPVAGKTGTAQVGAGNKDQGWYAALAPYPNPRYVIAVTIEHGGMGQDSAAPAARSIIGALFQPPPAPAPAPAAGQPPPMRRR